MSINLVNIGFNNMVVAQRIVAVIAPDSAPVRRIERSAKGKGCLINAACGRKARAVIITDTNYVILSALQPETIAERFPGIPDGKKSRKRPLKK